MKKNKIKKVSLDELFNVLSFYAEKNNYDKSRELNDGCMMTRIFIDKGSKARKILKRLLKEELNLAGIKNNL